MHTVQKSSELDPFLANVREALTFLQERFGLDLWMFTRVEGNDWIVLDAVDRHYGIRVGDVFRWSDSFCSRMVRGEGPSVAPRSNDVAAYVEAPIGRQVPIGAYVGFPLCTSDGSLFGTLCAIDPQPQADRLREETDLIRFTSRLLSSLLQAELRAIEAAREAERYRAVSVQDHLTGLANRRGWDEALHREEERCRRFGSPSAVIVLDLDDLKRTNDEQGHRAGDRLIVSAARVLAESVRINDLVARTGGDEFAVLLVEANAESVSDVTGRIESALDRAGIRASIGTAPRDPKSTLHEAMTLADRRMYEQKRRGENAAALGANRDSDALGPRPTPRWSHS